MSILGASMVVRRSAVGPVPGVKGGSKRVQGSRERRRTDILSHGRRA